MKANIRRLLSMLLVLAMVFGMIPAVFAEGEVTEVGTSADFIAAMANGGNIKLTADFTLGAKATIPAGKTVVLDLNGKTISSTNAGYYIENAGNLTINDSREGGKDGEFKMVPASESASVYALMNTGTLTINGGKITITTKSRAAYAISSVSSSVTINGGTIEAICNSTGSYSAYGIILKGDTSGSSVATINGGTFITESKSTGNSRCAPIYANCDNTQKILITINGGEFKSTRHTTRTASVVYFKDGECGATVVINGGTFETASIQPNTIEVDDCLFAGSKGSLTINGGTFTCDTSVFTSARTATITGGTFVKADGTKNDISSYVKVTGYTQGDNSAVAKNVDSSEALVAAMQTNGGIRLTKGIALTALAEVPAGKTVVLDFNGQTITSDDTNVNSGKYIKNSGTLTILDSVGGGGFTGANASTSYAAYAVYNAGVLTINGGHFIGNSTGRNACAVYSAGTSMTINGGTFEANYNSTKSYSAYALILSGDVSGTSAVTINDGTFITTSKDTGNSRCTPVYITGDYALTVTINDGKFESTRNVGRGASAVRSASSKARVVINGGTFEAAKPSSDDRMFDGTKGTLTITGGEFIYDGKIFFDNRPATITGGTFLKSDGTKNDISSYVKVAGYEQGADGTVAKVAEATEMVAQLISYYTNYQDAAATDIQRVLEKLKKKNAATGASWEKIMNYWSEVNAEDFVNVGTVPQGLPTDDSLCIVILGLKLNADGTMQDELVGRLQTGLAVANTYPNAYVCVTGGGTAANNPDVTEAGQMAAWLKENGLSEDRLIIEDKAGSTVANAKNTYDVLVADYQNVDNIVMVTSDYHISRGSLLYYTKFVLEAQATGGKEIGIIANAGFDTATGYESVATQSSSLCSLVGITYSNLPAVSLSMLQSLTVTQEAPYVAGNDLALTVTANYDSDFSREVEATITGFDKTKGPEQIITISYTENGVTREGVFRLSETSGQIISAGTVEVNTAAAFMTAMTNGGTIRLTGSFTLTARVAVPTGVTVVLDLNGKTITSNDGANIYLANQGDLTILDSSEEQTGAIVSNGKSGSSSSIYAVTNTGNLTIEGGHIKTETKYRSCYAIYSTGPSLVINGGTIEAMYTTTGGAYVCYMLGLGGTNSTVTINDGKFVATNTTTHVSSRSTAIYVLKDSNVQVTVNGGDFTVTREGSDGASFIRWPDDNTNSTITIKGGKIAVTEGDTISMFDNKKGTLSVIGGQFLNVEGEPFDIMTYLAAGYEQMDDGSIVVDDPNMPVVVELYGVKYKSLLRALKKSHAGDVLALSADVTLTDPLEIPEAVHIDLQGNTLEVDSLIAENSQIIDSAQEGLVKVAKDKVIFNAGNKHMPVWDEAAGGYRLAQVKIRTKVDAKSNTYYFRFDLTNPAWRGLLNDTIADDVSKVGMQVWVEGYDDPFAVPTDVLSRLYNDTTGTGAIKVTFKNASSPLKVYVGVAGRNVETTKSTGTEPAPVMAANGPVGDVDTVSAGARAYLAAAAAKYDNAGVAGLTDTDLTSAKSPTTKNLYGDLQPVAFNWTLENAKFIKADAKFFIELSTNADFTQSFMVDCVNYVAGQNAQSEPVWNLMTDTTYYWRVVSKLADGTETVTETKTIHTEAGPRQIHVDGAENIRDLGGWLVSHDVVLSDGTTVVYRANERTTQGRAYRSGRLETLNAYGIDTIVNELGIKTELDLRERNATYNVVSAYGVNYVQRSDGKSCLDYTAFLSKPDMAKESLLVFANADNYPILFNCYYGADRTGSLAFVLGLLQGVAVEDLVKDYELTTSRYLHRGGSLDIKAFMTGLDNLDPAQYYESYEDNMYYKARTFCRSAGLTDAQIDAIIVNMSGN